ncbi:hypothetical protein RJ639_002117 [Escallonia herrerae]|uniref:Reverse transcriptase Ty1/copia-type domain-containing protein n=1 Tax=Escallonia herrerae TaxID=1293975 RepID=A0AA88XIV4_9ASTE|nr:hypothetical protein RJ639_002117 [Escallonia herrerae]
MPPAPNDPSISVGRPLRNHKPPSYLQHYYVSIARSDSSLPAKQGSNATLLQSIKARLCSQFHTKDLGSLKYLLGIKVARSSRGLYLCQRKNTLDILDDRGLTGSRPSEFPMEQNLKLSNSTDHRLCEANPLLIHSQCGISSRKVEEIARLLRVPEALHAKEREEIKSYISNLKWWGKEAVVWLDLGAISVPNF